MDLNKTALERAFELAGSGAASGLKDIRAQLKAEGYDPQQVQGPSLSAQLREIMANAKKSPAGRD